MEKKIKTPRPYLSYSQLTLWERNPELYREVYIFGRSLLPNEAMLLGREFDELIETDEKSKGVWELLRVLVPREPKMQYELRANADGIPLLGKLDSFNPFTAQKIVREYKTGKTAWTQKLADRSTQLTFYAFLAFLKYGHIPKLYLHWCPVSDGGLTGEVKTFETHRGMRDFLALYGRIEKAWIGIQEMSKVETRTKQ